MLETWIPWNNLLISTYEKYPVLSRKTSIYLSTPDLKLLLRFSCGVHPFFPLLNPETDRDDWILLMLLAIHPFHYALLDREVAA